MARTKGCIWGVFVFLAIPTFSWGQVSRTLRIAGAVHDQTGAAVVGATVTVQSSRFRVVVKTDQSGRFSFSEVPASSGTLQVMAPGFSTLNQPWSATNSSEINLALVLLPAGANEQVVVSASRTEMRLAEAPGSIVALGPQDIHATPALTLDDVLRQVPGFSLFRRSDSRTANPTSQGVSLRGLGASGPSRALVLEDGTPITDPFGGWVYWDRVPRAALSSMEVFRGGASDLYGSNALGGVIQFLTRQPESPVFTLETSYGSEETPNLSFWTGTKIGRWDFFSSADMSRSDGYFVIPQSLRGSVDTRSNAEHGTLEFGVGHQLGSDGRIFVRGNLFDEARHNGTQQQVNDTHVASGVLGIEKPVTANDSLAAHLYTDIQSYNQSFSSVASDRNSETLTNLQHVPSQELGGDVQWTHVAGHGQTLLGGVSVQEVMGASDEQLISANAYSVSGGRQRTLSFFGEDVFRIHQKWTLIAGARVDHWQNFDGSTYRLALSSGTPTMQLFPDRSQTAFSPRISFLRQLTSNLSFTASAYRAFRAPTLNELYRSFRLGSIVTQNNPDLGAEHLTGAEAGLNASALDHRLQLRGTFFWSDIVDPVSNVTLTTTPSLITRQRQNLGRTRSRGVELESVAHFSPHIEFSAGYNYIDATVVSFPADTTLQGLNIPQVPRNQFTWSARYWNPSRIMLSVQGRFSGVQYDDDQNQFPLDSYYTMDIMAGRSLTHGVEIFGAAENVLNQRYQVARTPIVNLGPPILLSIGLRYNFRAGR